MNRIYGASEKPAATAALKNIGLESCRRLISQIEKARDAILNEFRGTLAAHQHLLELALNEAEALAWQTEYPHLVFPTLAAEKAQAVSNWYARQRSVQHTRHESALAA